MQVDASGADAARVARRASPGVTRVVESDRRDGAGRLRSRQRERPRRAPRARARGVSSGWGLLELRPMRMSLEEIFLSLTTEEAPTPAGAAAGGEAVHA